MLIKILLLLLIKKTIIDKKNIPHVTHSMHNKYNKMENLGSVDLKVCRPFRGVALRFVNLLTGPLNFICS